MIDAHVHVWTDDRVSYPRTAGERDYDPARFTPEDLFKHSKPAGVKRIVLIQMSFYRYDNTYMLHCMRDYPGVFSGVGIVDSQAPDPGKAMRELKRNGVRGFRITAGAAGEKWLEQPGMQAMWKEGAKERLAMCALVGPELLPSIDRMCERYRETPVVIDHLARIGAGGAVKDEDVRLLCRLARHPLVTVKASAFYALGRKTAPYLDIAPVIRRVYEDFGPRRIMWASDCPFQVANGHNYADSLALVREKLPFLNADDRTWMLEKTAESVFFGR